ncbi:hypothetical protein ACFQVC_13175 [Streptomyces monticola]|uniref:DUF1707 domain-containing protein n=1 Tax=Streptomyces monticola TaxID=2666263 RepID=A0ABW2JI98_9ACTN
MLPKKALTAALSVTLCGTLAVIPAASAAPKEPAPTSAGVPSPPPTLPPLPSLTSPSPQPPGQPQPQFPSQPPAQPQAQPPSGLTHDEDPHRDRERMARQWKMMGRSGAATGNSADLVGSVIGGEKDPKELDKGVAEANKSLDNLMAIAPGGSLARAKAAGRDVKLSVRLLKEDHLKLAEQAKKNDVAGWMMTAAFMIMHFGWLSVDICFALGLNVAQSFIPFKLPEFKLPEPPQDPRKTPSSQNSQTQPQQPRQPQQPQPMATPSAPPQAATPSPSAPPAPFAP